MDMNGQEEYGRYDHELAARSVEVAVRCQRFEGGVHWDVPVRFALLTALQVLGIELPRLDGDAARALRADGLQLVVGALAQRKGASTSRRSPVRCFVWGYALDTMVVGAGTTVTTPVCTWVMMAPWLSFDELVLLGWAILRRKTLHPKVCVQDFIDFLDAVEASAAKASRERRDGARRYTPRLPRGFGACRRAVVLLGSGTDSRQEARFILALLCHGLPMPERNVAMKAWDGSVFSLDAAYKAAKLAMEYDGTFHSGQWEEDAERRALIEESGWTFIQVTKGMLDDPGKLMRLLGRIARILADRTGIHYHVGKPVTYWQLSDERHRAWREHGNVRHPGASGDFGELELSDEWLESA
ncbi:MAG: hypothetical protein UHD09_08605 [Bifidobacterium sp.]|nr:hypothetical protein [Bifidobacterium sp.]